jgi:hypothetical protein
MGRSLRVIPLWIKVLLVEEGVLPIPSSGVAG